MGTNAILRSPPALFPLQFGPHSFMRYLVEAEACGVRAQVFRNAGLELDIDELKDLQKLAPLGDTTRTRSSALSALNDRNWRPGPGE